jgi:hypothetical protein
MPQKKGNGWMPLIEGCSRVFQAERPDGRGTAAIHLAGSWPVQRRLHWHGAGMALAWRTIVAAGWLWVQLSGALEGCCRSQWLPATCR